MKILHVCESLPGGPASYLDEILPAQAARFGGSNVTLLAPMAQLGHLRSAGGYAFVGYHRSGRNLTSVMRLGLALQRQLQTERPDILHLHSSLAGAVGRLVALAQGFSGRVVYCAHGWAIDPNRSSRAASSFRIVERLLYAASDAIVNISPHEEAFLPREWRDGGKVHLIQSGIAAAPAAAERARDGPGEGPPSPWRLLFVGRTDHQKGFDLLAREMIALEDEARLTVAGGAVVEAAHASVALPNVTVLGWLPRAEIDDHMRDADFVVMPSRWEGMPLVALEAMRAGRPVIASARGPFPHIIEHKRTGLLVDIDEPGFLRCALAEVSKDDALRMGDAARQAFLRRFTSGEMNRRLIQLYEELQRTPPRRIRAPALSPVVRGA